MKNEFNITSGGNENVGREYLEAEEVKTFSGNAAAKETSVSCGEYSESASAKIAKKQNQNSISNIFKGFFAVVVTLVVAVVAVSMSVDVSAQFVSLSVTDTSILYNVNFEGDKDAQLVVCNDFTRREVALEEGENEGEITGLKPNMKYTVAVVCKSGFVEKTVVEQSVRTDKYAASALVSEFYSIEHICTCNVDGCFHFTLGFIDENGWWSDFSASLTDAYGNVSYCVFTDDVHAEQSIDVALKAGLLGNSATFTLSFRTDSAEHCPDTDLLTFDEKSHTLTYSIIVKI